jgi:hypothetical protein
LIEFLELLDQVSGDILSDSIHNWYTELLKHLWNDPGFEEDYELQTVIGNTVFTICRFGGFHLSEEKASELMEASLSVLESTKRKHTGEFICIPRLYGAFEELMIDLIFEVEGPWINDFIARIFSFYEDNDPRVRRITVSLFRVIISRYENFKQNEIVNQIVKDGLRSIIENVADIIPDYCSFLNVLLLDSSELIDPDLPAVIVARLGAIQDAKELKDFIVHENLIALLCTFERVTNQRIIEAELLEMVIGCLPIQIDRALNNVVYVWIVWKVKLLQESPFFIGLLKLLCLPFLRPFEEVPINLQVKRIVWGSLITFTGEVEKFGFELFGNEQELRLFAVQMEKMRRIIAEKEKRNTTEV